MLNVCLLGDSHTASLKLAFDEIAADHPDIRVTYLVATRGNMEHLRCRDGVLEFGDDRVAARVKELCGQNTVTVSDFDVFICVGMRSRLHRFLSGLKRFRIVGTGEPAPFLVTRRTYVDLAVENFRSSILTNVLTQLDAAGGPPTLVLLKPLVSANVFNVPKSAVVASVYQELLENADMRAMVHGIFDEALARTMPDFATFVPQPEETTIKGVLTDEAYSVGSVSWADVDAEHEDTDINHMNAAFGHAMWSVLLPRLKAMQSKG